MERSLSMFALLQGLQGALCMNVWRSKLPMFHSAHTRPAQERLTLPQNAIMLLWENTDREPQVTGFLLHCVWALLESYYSCFGLEQITKLMGEQSECYLQRQYTISLFSFNSFCSCFFFFFFPTFPELWLTNKNYIHIQCTMWSSNRRIHCEMTPPRFLTYSKSIPRSERRKWDNLRFLPKASGQWANVSKCCIWPV